MPDQSQYFGESALRIPRVPGATPGQFPRGVDVARVAVVAGDGLEDLAQQQLLALGRLAVPGAPVGACSSRCAARSAPSVERSPAASRAVNSGLPVPPPEPAKSAKHGRAVARATAP